MQNLNQKIDIFKDLLKVPNKKENPKKGNFLIKSLNFLFPKFLKMKKFKI